MEEDKVEYKHPDPEENSKSFKYDFPLNNPNVILNKSIEDPQEFEKFIEIFSNHKESLSDLTGNGGDAMITE